MTLTDRQRRIRMVSDEKFAAREASRLADLIGGTPMALTDEQVRAIALSETRMADFGNFVETAYEDRARIGPTEKVLRALATEVLAQRERRCGMCGYHDASHVDMSGRLACLRLGRLVAADWFCADWRAKETTRRRSYDYLDVGTYDDATGTSYAPEGWYEEHDSDDPLMPLSEQPIHWMPLPEPPR